MERLAQQGRDLLRRRVPQPSSRSGPTYPATRGAAALAIAAGAFTMAVFHGLRGAFRLNAAAGRPNPATPASQGVRND